MFPSSRRCPIAPDLMLVLAVYLGVFHRNVGGALRRVPARLLHGHVLGRAARASTRSRFTLVFAGVQLVARSIWVEGVGAA